MVSSPEVSLGCAACSLSSFVKCVARGFLLYVNYHFLPKDFSHVYLCMYMQN